MKSFFSELTEEQNRTLWRKCLELHSFQENEEEMKQNLTDLRNSFLLLSVHHEYRSPWAIKKHDSKNETLAQIFAKNDPSSDNLVTISDKTIYNFIQTLYNDRKNLLLHFVSDERISAQRITCDIHSCQMTLGSFIATLIIPSFYGHFLGNENINAFIEAVGIVFDAYAHDPIPFLTYFDNSFICDVLRQFFFSPLMRPYVGEQFTVFYEFFASKRGDAYHYTRIQRFFTLFLKEMAQPIAVSPPFIRRLFARICEKHEENKEKVIMSVIIYCIVTNMISYPTAYSVYPLTSGLKEETNEFIQLVKFYCAFVSGLPLSQAILNSNTPVKDTEQVDPSYIHNLVDALLTPTAQDSLMPEIENVVISMVSVHFLAKFEENYEVQTSLQENRRHPETVLNFAMNSPPTINNEKEEAKKSSNERKKGKKKQNDIQLLVNLFISKDPNGFIDNYSPSNRSIIFYLMKNMADSLNYDSILSILDRQSKEETDFLISTHTKIDFLSRSIDLTRNAISASEAKFANDIVTSIMSSDSSIMNEIEKKKSQMMNDPNIFASFITSHLDSFLSKNAWCSPMMRMVARRFHAQVMRSFGTSDFLRERFQLIHTDQNFINQKNHFLATLEQNGLDEKVAKIVKYKDILAAAQTTVLRACLFENPLESAKLIVLSLFVVEDLFIFEFGEPPEANQLMPLLANLFISSPIPNPLSFGEWLAHFLQKLMQSRPEWFSDESMMPLEHYFQFNVWIQDMLQSLENSK